MQSVLVCLSCHSGNCGVGESHAAGLAQDTRGPQTPNVHVRKHMCVLKNHVAFSDGFFLIEKMWFGCNVSFVCLGLVLS